MARSKARLDPVQAARKAAQGREAKRNKERKEEAQKARTAQQDTQPSQPVQGKESNSSQPTHVPQQTKDPRRSIYYDPVFNPYGAAPPGMLYMEKPYEQLVSEGLVQPRCWPPLPEDSDQSDSASTSSDSESSVDEDLKDIIMPSDPYPSLPTKQKSAVPPSIPAKGRPQGRGGRGDASQSQSRSYNGAAATSTTQSPSISGPAAAGPQLPAPPASNSVITAAPQLRDMKKEATVFVPASLRKKQTAAGNKPIQDSPNKGDLE